MALKIFVDTGYILALFNTTDEYHEQAKRLRDITHPPNSVIITEAVLLEVGNALSKPHIRDKCASIIRGFYESSNVEVVPLTTALIGEGLEYFEKRKDKDWGLTDCISFVVMQKRGIRQALAADDHFIQAGFKSLLIE